MAMSPSSANRFIFICISLFFLIRSCSAICRCVDLPPFSLTDEIEERQKAVQHLLNDPNLTYVLTNFLKKRKIDVERKLAKIHYSTSLYDFVTALKEVFPFVFCF